MNNKWSEKAAPLHIQPERSGMKTQKIREIAKKKGIEARMYGRIGAIRDGETVRQIRKESR